MITKLDTATAVIESLPDPPKKHDMQQTGHCVQAISTLEAHFRKRDDVLVSGNGYLIVSTGSVRDWGQHFYPDCVVAFGVDPKAIVARNGYVISEVGKPPEFVLEIASRTTARRDETVKREGYAKLSVPECWGFDGSGEGYYSQPLWGGRLVGDAFEPIELTEEADGEVRGYSPALSLYLCVDVEDRLRFWDPATQEYLSTHLEAMEGQAQAIEERDQERSARIEAEDRVADVEDERDRERSARIEAESEIAMLRDRLQPPPTNPS